MGRRRRKPKKLRRKVVASKFKKLGHASFVPDGIETFEFSDVQWRYNPRDHSVKAVGKPNQPHTA